MLALNINKLKIGLLAMVLVFYFLPHNAYAKTLNFADKTWEILPAYSKTAEKLPLKNNLDLLLLSKNAILGDSYYAEVRLLDEATVAQIETIKTAIDLTAQNANLKIQGKFAKDFKAGNDGKVVDINELQNLLASDLPTAQVPVLTTYAPVKLPDTNNLGIDELVAIGESNFAGSPKNRIHNIEVGATKFDGLIIGTNEEFSFNKFLGDVDSEHGFLPELVIKATGVTPEFGGGLCQVSSTAFRAAMNAGLPITARRNHSFAVQYYAPQGTDATIYPGSADLKFVNDLKHPILIHTKIIDKKLYFEFYGTKDARAIAFDGPYQYDKKTNGSMKAVWTRHVTLNGQTTEQIFRSVYRPPAEFHPTEQSSTPNPEAANEQPNAQ